MATVLFDHVPQRTLTQETPIVFGWPREGETFSYTVSIDDGQTFVAGAGAITENPTDGVPGEYSIPYYSQERPDGPGLVIYKFTDGTDTAKIYVNIIAETAQLSAPSIPGTTYLTSLEEMERKFSAVGVSEHTADVLDNTEVITEIVMQATEHVLMFLRDRYDVEDMLTSIWVREQATALACFRLSKRSGNPGVFRDDFELAEMNLAQARDGQLNIGLPTNHRIAVQTPVYDARFFQPMRLNEQRSTKVFSGQKLRYYHYWYE
jgi:hypothetical protein